MRKTNKLSLRYEHLTHTTQLGCNDVVSRNWQIAFDIQEANIWFIYLLKSLAKGNMEMNTEFFKQLFQILDGLSRDGGSGGWGRGGGGVSEEKQS